MKSGRKPFWLRRSFLRGNEAEASTMASSSAPGSSCCPEWPDASWRCRSVSRISSGTKKNFNEICQNAIFTFWKTLKILRREITQQSAVDGPTARLPNDTLTTDQIVFPFFHLKTANQWNDLSLYRLLNSLPLCETSYFASNFATTTARLQFLKHSFWEYLAM